MIGQLITDVEAFGAALKKNKAVNVNDQETKDACITIATKYFSEVRPHVVSACGENEDVLKHDELWQNLVRLAHGSNPRKSYLSHVGRIKKQLSTFNISLLTTPVVEADSPSGEVPLSTEETLLLETLDALVPSAAASYRQGVMDLYGAERLSYRGTATEFREALRETLDHLAPDKDVKEQSWYKPVDERDKPTMAQKTRFILTSRGYNKTQWSVAEKTLKAVEEFAGEVARAVYNRASLATHVHQSQIEVRKIKRYVDTVLFDILEI